MPSIERGCPVNSVSCLARNAVQYASRLSRPQSFAIVFGFVTRARFPFSPLMHQQPYNRNPPSSMISNQVRISTLWLEAPHVLVMLSLYNTASWTFVHKSQVRAASTRSHGCSFFKPCNIVRSSYCY
jgi:hypothetical protein